MFARRPKPDDSEEDILAMQKEWEMAKEQNKQRATVQIQRMKRNDSNATVIFKEDFKPKSSLFEANGSQRGRFSIDLENIAEEWSNQVLHDVKEKNEEWLEGRKSDELAKQGTDKFRYSKDDGFPDVLDLKAYYDNSLNIKLSSSGKSFFAAEFDRLHGRIESIPCTSSGEIDSEDFHLENDRFIASLSPEKIALFCKEIQEKIDPNVVSFLMQRRKSKKMPPSPEKLKPNASKFKQSREVSTVTKPLDINPPAQLTEIECSSQSTIDDVVKQLEVLNTFTDRKDEENYSRLAADAIQLDFATKCLRNVVPRQQQNAIKLFDNCKVAPESQEDKLLTLARSCIDDMKKLYLEEVKSGDRTFWQFAREVNPMINGSWTLVPVRTVLDAVHKREGHVLLDDLEIIKLSLLWTVLIHDERPSAFLAFADPVEIYIRIAEAFLIGREVIAHDVITECISRLLNGYILKSAREGRLVLRLTNKVAGLDAFMPFFEDLLRHFEEYSVGDVNFAKTLLIGAYLNSDVGDSIECCLTLWSPKNLIARQLTIGIKDGANILTDIKRMGTEKASFMEKQHYVQYTSLLGAYATAIRDEKVTRDRNPIMFAIAADELGRFIQRHTRQEEKINLSQAKEFDVLVNIIRSTVKSQLKL